MPAVSSSCGWPGGADGRCPTLGEAHRRACTTRSRLLHRGETMVVVAAVEEMVVVESLAGYRETLARFAVPRLLPAMPCWLCLAGCVLLAVPCWVGGHARRRARDGLCEEEAATMPHGMPCRAGCYAAQATHMRRGRVPWGRSTPEGYAASWSGPQLRSAPCGSCADSCCCAGWESERMVRRERECSGGVARGLTGCGKR